VTALDVPLLAVGTILTVLLFAFGVRRLLGLRLSTLRTLSAGLIAFAVASPIITTIGRSAVTTRKPAAVPAVLFVILGVAIALLAPGFDMVAEARRFAADQLAEQFSQDVLGKTAADELAPMLPMLR